MKAEFLKIAGVKSEAEFYKKFPSEDAFMKKHGKAVKKLMTKKAQVGTMIKNIETPTSNPKPVKIGEEFLYNSVADLTGGESYDDMMKKMQYQANLQAGQQQQSSGDDGGMMKMLPQMMEIFGGSGGGAGMEGAMGGMSAGMSGKNGGTFSPHMMYNSKTGKSKKVKTLNEHLALKKKGWGHSSSKAQTGTNMSADSNGNFMNSNAVQNFGIPIVGDVIDISNQIKAQKENLASAKQNRMVAEVALQASKTTPEKIERQYVRPEDFTNTGEEFFPVYGVGTNVLSKNGGAYKAQDGGMFTGEYTPLVDPNKQKAFGQGGVLGSNSYLVPRAAGGISYGGGQAGQLGMQAGDMVGFNNDAGSNIGGKVGGTIGSIFGPAGSAIGGFIGSGIGDLIDRNDRRVSIEEDKIKRINKEMAYGSVAPAIQAGYASHVKNGGKVPAYRSGGNMRGDYVSPNPSALDTMAMGGELKSLWGGELETVSYNPYAGGESVEPKNANSHSYRDPKTGQTGQGIAYGENSVSNNEASVEIEGGEPMQKLKQGGEEENLVVFGDMYIPGTNQKFKNRVSNVLNKEEAKINKRQEKVATLGLESDNTLFGKLEKVTADTVLKGSDMKLKKIAAEKMELAELQNAMNETFDEYGIDANKFLKKGEMVKDPMRIENTEMAKYGKDIPKAQVSVTGNVKKDDFNKIPKTLKSKEQLIKEKYVQDPDNPLKFTRGTEEVIATEALGSSLGNTPEGQSIDVETGLAGGIAMEQISELEKDNPWFGKFDFTKPKVKYKGKMVHPDVLKFQKEYNKQIKGSDIKPIQKIDGVLGQETFAARFTPGTEAKDATVDEVFLEEDKKQKDTEEVKTQRAFPMLNFQRPIEDVPLEANQLLGEYYAMATNQVQPVQAQGFQPSLRTPYDISFQDMRNDVTSQSRALQRNPVLQNNPAALALAQAPTYDAYNKINAEEFRQNQAMKDTVYSGNLEAINKAKIMNLGIFDKQADRQAQAAANTRTQNIDILSSISNKYAQNKRDNAMRKVYANMYPTYRFDENYQTQVQQPTVFNTGQTNTGGIGPFISGGGFGGGQTMQQVPGMIGALQSIFGNQEQPNEEQSASAKYGKKVTKNNKNSNILKALRNL